MSLKAALSVSAKAAKGDVSAHLSAEHRVRRVEHEYERMGAVTYLDAWDVHRGWVMGRTEPKSGIATFDRG